MRYPTRIGHWRAARDWPLLGALLTISLGAAIAMADLIYRHSGALFYPSLALVNYSLRGLPAQLPALAIMTIGLLAVWTSTRRQSRTWMAVGALILLIACVWLIAGRSPYRPVTSVLAGGQRYDLASFHDNEQTPSLYVLFACEPTGLLCHEVSAYAPFDVLSGQFVAGSPELVARTSAHTITIQVGNSIIGVYALETR